MDVPRDIDGAISQFLLVSPLYTAKPQISAQRLIRCSTYGPQAPTAFSNGPSCIEIQADWITSVLCDMRERNLSKIDADRGAEEKWRELVFELINDTPRGKVDSWYNGANIPGKPREHLNYAGGIPRYKKTLEEVRREGYRGFGLR